MSGTVLVIGSVNVDLTVTAATLPRPGETVAGGSYEERDGGKGANQAVAAARAGAVVAFVGAVGDDPHGARARTALAEAGVDVAGLATVPGVATGVALIVVDAEGENQIAVASGANHQVDPEAAATAVDLLDPQRGVLLLGLEVLDAPAVAAAQRAARCGVRVLLNPAPARPLPRELEAGVLLTPNRDEASALTGEAEPEAAARALRKRTGAAVVVTLGAGGALFLPADGDLVAVPAPRVAAVDTTGAGDAFNGALAAALAAGVALADAVEQAVTAASRSATRLGARG